MAKDPAFLFYTSDFLTGIQDLDMEERGIYITLLCLQHQKGHLTEKMLRLCHGKISVDVLAKFSKDKEGNYFNERLEKEIILRAEFSEKQRNRAIDGWKKRKDIKSHGNATALPYEDVNENVIDNKDLSLNNKIASKNFFYFGKDLINMPLSKWLIENKKIQLEAWCQQNQVDINQVFREIDKDVGKMLTDHKHAVNFFNSTARQMQKEKSFAKKETTQTNFNQAKDFSQ
jgi:uncharacterized protein YdaU (DUF1376 family)